MERKTNRENWATGSNTHRTKHDQIKANRGITAVEPA